VTDLHLEPRAAGPGLTASQPARTRWTPGRGSTVG